tara:strand:- start:336 stop:677 length:342 start_codon:yes stop_codon:yes gene_type:complete
MEDKEYSDEVYSVIKFYNEEENPMNFFNEFTDENFVAVRADYVQPYNETIMFSIYRVEGQSSHMRFLHRLNIEEFCEKYNMNMEQVTGVTSGVIEDEFYKFIVINSRCPIVEE